VSADPGRPPKDVSSDDGSPGLQGGRPDAASPGQSPSSREGASEGAGGEGSGVDLARALLAQARARAREQRRTAPRRAPAVPRTSGPRPDGRDPQPFASGIERLVSERGWQAEIAVAGAVARWAEIVGADIAGHTTPESFSAGVLRVRASSTAWATQLRMLAPNLVAALNAELGHGTVTRIEVLAPVAPSWRRGQLRVQDGRGPRDTYG
jgi:predicted nucleic acid-binding Zn ribbon protein